MSSRFERLKLHAERYYLKASIAYDELRLWWLKWKMQRLERRQRVLERQAFQHETSDDDDTEPHRGH